jgi:hypothetical protein
VYLRLPVQNIQCTAELFEDSLHSLNFPVRIQFNMIILMLSNCGFQEGCSGSTSGDARAAEGIHLHFVTLWNYLNCEPCNLLHQNSMSSAMSDMLAL